jgi:Uma2 family endonuclease
MSTTPVQIPVEEYLRTVYRPDCDYIDGEVLERNMGETPHARLQAFFVYYLRSREDEWQIDVLSEQRVQVGANRYRIPDVVAAAIPNLDDRILHTPPLLCIEILSSEDRMRKVQERIDDYARMGVRASWIIDPWRGTAFQAGPDAILHPIEDRLTVPGTAIAIAVPDIFAELDRLQKRASTAPPSTPQK